MQDLDADVGDMRALGIFILLTIFICWWEIAHNVARKYVNRTNCTSMCGYRHRIASVPRRLSSLMNPRSHGRRPRLNAFLAISTLTQPLLQIASAEQD